MRSCEDCGAPLKEGEGWIVPPDFPAGYDDRVVTLGEIALCETCEERRRGARSLASR